MYRVIWQYGLEQMGPLDAPAVPVRPLELRAVDPLFAGVPLVGAPEPVFRRPSMVLRAQTLALSARDRSDPLLDLAGFHHAFVRDAAAAASLRERLLNESGVLLAEIQARPEPAVIWVEERIRRRNEHLGLKTRSLALSIPPAPTPSFEGMQGYLDAAPDGVDARHAWSRPGGRGSGVRVIDIEYGWNFGHEDLRQKQTGVVFGPATDDDHGTAVLGIFSGDEDGRGITGIAPDAVAAAASASWDGIEGKWNAAAAIEDAANRLAPGDVILLEMHAPRPGGAPDQFIPIEYWSSEFAAIRYATSRGIHVVEAGGNGYQDLDAPIYGGAFDPAVRDSSAILVGGGSSPYQPRPRSRIDWSNFGARLDVQGWGEDIVTAGGRSLPVYYDLQDSADPSRCYTASFGGTSGASPIVVGVVAAIGGCLKAAGRPPLDPLAMRDLLVRTGTAQTDGPDGPATQHIGPLPDLRRALADLNL